MDDQIPIMVSIVSGGSLNTRKWGEVITEIARKVIDIASNYEGYSSGSTGGVRMS